MYSSIRPAVAIAITLAALGAPRAAGAQVSDLAAPSDLTAPPADATKSATGLISKRLNPGTSDERPAATDIVTVNYTGWASDGRMFDSTAARGNTSTFPLNRVMAGWKECVQLMVIGEKRRCWVPQDLAYKGQAGKPTGTVVFDIELIDTRPSPTIPPPDVAEIPKDASRTASGLAYKVIRKGTGFRHPDGLREVLVHYTGWTTDGKMFDSSVPSGQPGAPKGMLVFDVELIRIES